jgi:hypothetical protein
MRSIEPGCFRPHACWSLWKALEDASDCMLVGLFGKLLLRSMRGALLTWFHGVWTCGVEVFLNIE